MCGSKVGYQYCALYISPDRSDFPLVSVKNLPSWAQLAFPDIKEFNIVQSSIYNAAFKSSANLLISAPTGAGKTNIALLTVLQQIGRFFSGNSESASAAIPAKNFKVVYIAPMKSLVNEVTKKFQAALRPLGIQVAELTADMNLSKFDIERKHLIVTVPEKWDVITRNGGSFGISEDVSILNIVSLLIIDEIHLLNDDRGPVIEAIVARTLRAVESSQRFIRIVGISATLPNWIDIGTFLRVEAKNIFRFDSSYRPVPLQQTLIGIQDNNNNNQVARKASFNKACFQILSKTILEGHQSMVFVTARMETVATAKELIAILRRPENSTVLNALVSSHSKPGKYSGKFRDENMQSLLPMSFGVHHAGMARRDRNLVEELFIKGTIKVLVCTSTLAWGVNLPVRSVIIKGTSFYDSNVGNFRDMGILDILQIFGRAGRPQYDNIGHGTLITSLEKLTYYLNLLSHQIPIESRFATELEESLNAEIVLGTISNNSEAITWLTYTFLFIRIFQSPQTYGIPLEQVHTDPGLFEFRRSIIDKASQSLCNNRLIRITHQDDSHILFAATELGRIASRFYVRTSTCGAFRRVVEEIDSNAKLLHEFGEAEEMQQLVVRNSEIEELESLRKICPIDLKGDISSTPTKVAILLLAHLLREPLESSSLISDSYFVVQNAQRLFRAFSEIALVCCCSDATIRILTWCVCIERRMWPDSHPLFHFCFPGIFNDANQDHRKTEGILSIATVAKIEKRHLFLDELLDMNLAELRGEVREYDQSLLVHKCLQKIPQLSFQLRVQPITNSIVKIIIKIVPNWRWSDNFHGTGEPFKLILEDPSNQLILHSEEFVIKKRTEEFEISFTVPLSRDDVPSQYVAHIISDRWVGIKFEQAFSLNHLLLPERNEVQTSLLNLHPLEVKVVLEPYKCLYNEFTHLNPIQTQLFHTCYHTDFNVLLGAPTGSGKTLIAEFAMLRLFSTAPDQIVVYVAPLKALAKERMNDWENRVAKLLDKRVIELTGDVSPDLLSIESANVVITTPEKWDVVSRDWRRRSYVRRVGLIILDEVHLLGVQRGAVLEAIVSRMRYISSVTSNLIRFVGLSTALANSVDIADWLAVGQAGLFNFKPSVRPVPCVVHVSGFPMKHYCPRMASMNKPAFQAIKAYSPKKPVLIFVSSRRQTRLTALDLISLCCNDCNPEMFLNAPQPHMISEMLAKVHDDTLRGTLQYGIGLHHAGLKEADRLLVEKLFKSGIIQVLVTTATLAWGVNLPAHLVIVKGTEVYDNKKGGYVDVPITDLLQMIGRAGRPQFDQSAVACVFVIESKKDFYKKFLYEPFPVESFLPTQLLEHLNAEIVAQSIASNLEAVNYVTWTYLFRRLSMNPGYYNILLPGRTTNNEEEGVFTGQLTVDRIHDRKSRSSAIATFIENMIADVLQKLVETDCVLAERLDNSTVKLTPTVFGFVASKYYISIETLRLFKSSLSRKSLNWIQIVRLISNSIEYSNVPVRHNEEILNETLAKKCPWEITSSFESSNTKAFLLFQCHFFRIPLPIVDYLTDLHSVLDQSIRLVQACLDISVEMRKFQSAIHCYLVLACLFQGATPFRSSLCSLPNHQRAELEMNGIKDLYQVIESKTLRSLINEDFPQMRVYIAVQLLSQAAKWETIAPQGVKGVYVIPEGLSNVRIKVKLKYINNPSGEIVGGWKKSSSRYGWGCLLGYDVTDDIVDFKRVPPFLHNNSAVMLLEFEPLQRCPGCRTAQLLILSDTFQGLDQQFDLPFCWE